MISRAFVCICTDAVYMNHVYVQKPAFSLERLFLNRYSAARLVISSQSHPVESASKLKSSQLRPSSSPEFPRVVLGSMRALDVIVPSPLLKHGARGCAF
jgi:hypothetical protein